MNSGIVVTAPKKRTRLTRGTALAAVGVVIAVGGCGLAPPPANEDSVFVSVINVTPHEVSVTISAVSGDLLDTVQRSAPGPGSADVAFVCVDELVLGDPLDPARPAVVVDPEGIGAEIPPFSILAGDAFFCGDIVEFVISGDDADSFAVDVFAFAPP